MPRIEEIIKFAIEQENKAAQRYKRLSEQVKNPETQTVLLNMMHMEEDHRVKLENVDLKEFLYSAKKQVIDLHFTDDKEIYKKLKDLSPEDSLVMAAQFEEDARDLYLALSEACSVNSTARDLFLKLAEEEAHHKFEIESQLIKSMKNG